MGPLAAITIGSLRDIPAGTLSYTMRDGKSSNYVTATWGGDTEDTGSGGPVVKYRLAGDKESQTAKLSEDALEQLFAAATKLTKGYSIPRSTTSDNGDRNSFQLMVGHIYDPVLINFPANEVGLWNRGAACWGEFGEILKKDASLTLPEAKRLEDANSAELKPGLAEIAEYKSMDLSVQRVDRGKSNYGTISAKWNRTKDGAITFTAKYDGRTGDRIEGSPSPAQIRPIFNELQKLTKGYRNARLKGSKNGRPSRSYDSIDVGIKATGQPGEFLLPYFSTDSSQWGKADRLWSLLLELFPRDKRYEIIQ
ncbi:MAG: hypothetical protein ACSHX6_05165 [Akkermansiaceae bacterium]